LTRDAATLTIAPLTLGCGAGREAAGTAASALLVRPLRRSHFENSQLPDVVRLPESADVRRTMECRQSASAESVAGR